MADEKNWIREAMFYHIYPLGFTGAPLRNEGEATAGGRILAWDQCDLFWTDL